MFQNEYLLDIDLKIAPSFTAPRFRRGDTAILRFRLHDNGTILDSSQYDIAEITIVMPSKAEIVDYGKKETIHDFDLVTFQFAPLHMVEIGVYTIYLTLIKDGDRVSAPPLRVRFYDNLNPEDWSFITIIEDMQKEIIAMQLRLSEGINLNQIDVPNGVASLDASKKILDDQAPVFINEHIETYIRSDNGVHGLRITSDGTALYKDQNGEWKNVIFSETPIEEML